MENRFGLVNYTINDATTNLAQSEIKIIEENLKENLKIVDIDKIRKEEELLLFNLIDEFLQDGIDYTSVTLKEILIDSNEDYIDNQHSFMSGGQIVLDIIEDNFIIITRNKLKYIIDTQKVDTKYYCVLLNTFSPQKITFNSKSLYEKLRLCINGLYDLPLVFNILFNIPRLDLDTLIRLVSKTEVEFDYDSFAYMLFELQRRVNFIIQKTNQSKLINKEHLLLPILNACELNGIPINHKSFQNYIYDLKENKKIALELLKEKYGSEILNSLTSKDDLLNYLHSRNITSSINESLLKSLGLQELYGYIVIDNKLSKLDRKELNHNENRLYISYDYYDKYGNIKPNIDIAPLYLDSSNRNVVVGKYHDLFFRIFANEIKEPLLIEGVNSNDFNTYISDKILDNYTELDKFLVIEIIKALAKYQVISYNQLKNYLYLTTSTIVEIDKIKFLVKSILGKMPNLSKRISEFSKKKSRDKRFTFETNSNFYNYILLTQSDIYKTAILHINESIQQYNCCSKARIDIIALLEDKIIVQCDKEALNVAIDVLNRKLPEAYSEYVKSVISVCEVYSL